MKPGYPGHSMAGRAGYARGPVAAKGRLRRPDTLPVDPEWWADAVEARALEGEQAERCRRGDSLPIFHSGGSTR